MNDVKFVGVIYQVQDAEKEDQKKAREEKLKTISDGFIE